MHPATKLLLEDMLANARLAQKFIAGVDESEFAADIGLIYQVTHAIGLLGEAASRVDGGDRNTMPALPWRRMIDMRNKLIHGYRTVRTPILFETVRDDVPILIAELERLLNEGSKS